ncbi:DUF3726 domain-containing protein [Rhodospirillaceae bacterium]|nr:DUF3726 domain-containing protein [Rhodospirillaceae bacterium]
MNHRISYNEIVTTVAKALFALGVSPGVDVENAKNIAWLEASKLGGVSILADEIAKIDGLRQWPIPKIEKAEEAMVITPSIPSSLSLVQTSLDFVEIGQTVIIKMCSAPLLIFAESARRATQSKGFNLKWVTDGVLIEGVCELGWSHINKPSQIGRGPADVMVNRTEPKLLSEKASDNSIYERSISNGMLVDLGSWFLINQIAKETLVPSNIHSRGSAGAEVDDSS